MHGTRLLEPKFLYLLWKMRSIFYKNRNKLGCNLVYRIENRMIENWWNTIKQGR